MNNHLTIFLLLVALSGFGQFNERLVVLPGANETSSIHVNGEHIAVVSRVLSSFSTPNSGVRWHTCYSILDNSGAITSTDVYITGLAGLFSVEDGFSEDSNLHIQCGGIIDSTDTGGAFYVLFDAQGDTARFTTMYNPWYSTDPDYPGTAVMLPRDFYLDEQGYVFMSYGGQSGEFTASDAGVICYGPDDTYQWHIDFIDWEVHEHVFALTKYNDLLFLALNQQPTFVYDANIIIHKVNPLTGEILQSYDEPWDINVTEVMEMIGDTDGLVAVGSTSEAIDIPSEGLIMKLDEDMNLIWATSVEHGELNNRRRYEDVTIATDGHYVASGQAPYELDEPDPVNGTFMSDVTLAKFHRDTGELMWQRFYRVVESEDKTHSVWDVRATADGGLIFCGESLDYTEEEYTSENPVQQGWVVKVDSFGCLVEGCQNSIDEVEGAAGWFMAGPNPLPSGTPLNVYLASQPPTGASLVLTDMQGKRVASTPASGYNTTLIWQLPALPAATYLLSLVDGATVLQTEKVQIIR
jgi:hypothetical protein